MVTHSVAIVAETMQQHPCESVTSEACRTIAKLHGMMVGNSIQLNVTGTHPLTLHTGINANQYHSYIRREKEHVDHYIPSTVTDGLPPRAEQISCYMLRPEVFVFFNVVLVGEQPSSSDALLDVPNVAVGFSFRPTVSTSPSSFGLAELLAASRVATNVGKDSTRSIDGQTQNGIYNIGTGSGLREKTREFLASDPAWCKALPTMAMDMLSLLCLPEVLFSSCVAMIKAMPYVLRKNGDELRALSTVTEVPMRLKLRKMEAVYSPKSYFSIDRESHETVLKALSMASVLTRSRDTHGGYNSANHRGLAWSTCSSICMTQIIHAQTVTQIPTVMPVARQSLLNSVTVVQASREWCALSPYSITCLVIQVKQCSPRSRTQPHL